MDCLAQTVDSGRSTLCARQSMDCPRSTVCAEHIYVCIWLRVAFVRLNVPENTPIQSITRSARAHWQLTPILDMLGLEASRIDSRSLGNSWHRDFAALTESVYKLELLPVALYDADDQKATTCTARR